MKALLTIFLVALLCAPGLFAQNSTISIMSANTIIPATPEYGPDGAAAQDSAWIQVGTRVPLTKSYLYLLCDSVAGYNAADDTVAVRMILGIDGEATHYFDKLDTLLLFDDQIGAAVPGDSGFVIDVPAIPCDKYRFLVTVDDTISVTLTEKQCYPAPK